MSDGSQMDAFRHMEGSNGTLKFNYRPVQKLGDRKVYHRLEGYVLPSEASSLSSTMIYIILNVLLVRLLSWEALVAN